MPKHFYSHPVYLLQSESVHVDKYISAKTVLASCVPLASALNELSTSFVVYRFISSTLILTLTDSAERVAEGMCLAVQGLVWVLNAWKWPQVSGVWTPGATVEFRAAGGFLPGWREWMDETRSSVSGPHGSLGHCSAVYIFSHLSLSLTPNYLFLSGSSPPP